METIEYFSDFLRKVGAPNFLAIGIVIIVLWLFISGLRKGLKKGRQDKELEDNNKHNSEEWFLVSDAYRDKLNSNNQIPACGRQGRQANL